MYRYIVDTLNQFTWVVIDKINVEILYIVFLVPVMGKLCNWQLTLASSDQAEPNSFFSYTEEIYTLEFYAYNQLAIQDLIEPILEYIEHTDTDIDNPIQLALSLGGSIRGTTIQVPMMNLSKLN